MYLFYYFLEEPGSERPNESPNRSGMSSCTLSRSGSRLRIYHIISFIDGIYCRQFPEIWVQLDETCIPVTQEPIAARQRVLVHRLCIRNSSEQSGHKTHKCGVSLQSFKIWN